MIAIFAMMVDSMAIMKCVELAMLNFLGGKLTFKFPKQYKGELYGRDKFRMEIESIEQMILRFGLETHLR